MAITCPLHSPLVFTHNLISAKLIYFRDQAVSWSPPCLRWIFGILNEDSNINFLVRIWILTNAFWFSASIFMSRYLSRSHFWHTTNLKLNQEPISAKVLLHISYSRKVIKCFPTAELDTQHEHTKINSRKNWKGCDSFETTAGKLSARKIQICFDYFCKNHVWLLFFKIPFQMMSEEK